MLLLWISCCLCLNECDLSISSFFYSPDFWRRAFVLCVCVCVYCRCLYDEFTVCVSCSKQLRLPHRVCLICAANSMTSIYIIIHIRATPYKSCVRWNDDDLTLKGLTIRVHPFIVCECKCVCWLTLLDANCNSVFILIGKSNLRRKMKANTILLRRIPRSHDMMSNYSLKKKCTQYQLGIFVHIQFILVYFLFALYSFCWSWIRFLLKMNGNCFCCSNMSFYAQKRQEENSCINFFVLEFLHIFFCFSHVISTLLFFRNILFNKVH